MYQLFIHNIKNENIRLKTSSDIWFSIEIPQISTNIEILEYIYVLLYIYKVEHFVYMVN